MSELLKLKVVPKTCCDVLVVDDNQYLTKLFQLAGKRLGVGVDVAINGFAALNKCKTTDYRIIFSEIEVKKIDGIRFVQKLRELPERKSATVILMNKHLESFSEQLLKLSDITLLKKPIKLSIIEQKFRLLF